MQCSKVNVDRRKQELQCKLPSVAAWQDEFLVGDWCAVEYDGTLFPGEIRSLQVDDYEVSVIVKAGKYWKWPQLEDKILYWKQNVQKKLNAPKVVSSRGHFTFDEF